jgi:hypothetical protein
MAKTASILDGSSHYNTNRLIAYTNEQRYVSVLVLLASITIETLFTLKKSLSSSAM